MAPAAMTPYTADRRKNLMSGIQDSAGVMRSLYADCY